MSGSTYDKLEYLNETKARIRQAIIRKGQSVGVNDTFRSYADKIDAISSGGSPVLKDETFNENGVYTVSSENIRGFGFYVDSSNKETYTGSTPLVGDYVWIKGNIWNNQVGNSVYNNIVTPNGNVPNFDQPIMTITNIVPEVRINMSCLPEDYWLMCFGEQVSIDDTTFIKQRIWDKSVSSVAIVGDYVWIEANDPLSVSLGDNVYNSTDDTDSTPDLSEPIATISMFTQGYQVSTSDLSYSLQTLNSLNIRYNETKNYDGYGQVTVDVVPNLGGISISNNGTYRIDDYKRTYYGMSNTGIRDIYIGSSALAGNYIWFNKSTEDLQVGDVVYNGTDNSDVPNLNDVLGQVSAVDYDKKIGVSFLPEENLLAVSDENAIKIDGTYYIKIYCDSKSQSSVNIVGDYVWVKADDYWKINVGDNVYNSTDSSDTAPDLNAGSIGTVSYKWSTKIIRFNFTPSQYGFVPNDEITWSNNIDGWDKIDVNVAAQPSLKNETFTQNGVYTASTETEIGFGFHLDDFSKETYTGSIPLVGDYVWLKGNISDVQIGDQIYNNTIDSDQNVPNFNQPIMSVNNVWPEVRINMACFPEWTWMVCSEEIVTIDDINYIKQRIWSKDQSTVTIIGDYVWIRADNSTSISIGDNVYNSTDNTDVEPNLNESITTISMVRQGYTLSVSNLASSLQSLNDSNIQYSGVKTYDGYGQVTVDVDIPLLKDETFTENGVYSLSPETHTYVALAWWGDSKQAYTGSSSLVGDYIWFHTDNFYDPEIGDSVYNGQIVDGQNIPNFEDAISTIIGKAITSEFQVSFLPTNWDLMAYNPPIEFDGLSYYKVGIHSDAKAVSSVSIVGDYVWIRADKLEDIVEGTLIYNSTDSSDTAPDTTTSIGTVTSNDNMSVLYHFADVSGYGFRYYKYAQTSSYTETKNWGGYRQVTVDVPSASGTVVQATNNTGSNIAEGVRVWIRPKGGDSYVIRDKNDISVNDLTAVTIEPINDQQTGRVQTLLDGIGSYAPSTSSKTIYTNGTFRADAENLYGYDKIIVDVAGGGTNQDMTFPVDGVYTAGQGYSGLGTVTVIAGETAQKRMAEDLMLVNDGETEFTLTVSPSTANVSIISNTNQIGIVPSSSSSGVYTFNISADSLKTYNYTISNPGYETVSGSISGGTSSMVVTLDEESGI